MTHQIRLDVTVPPELLARLKAAHAAGYAQHPQSFAAFVRGILEDWLRRDAFGTLRGATATAGELRTINDLTERDR